MAFQYEFMKNDTNNATTISSIINDNRITSKIVPYEIIDIAHVVPDPLNQELRGRLSVSICPGKKDTRSNRDLDLDLKEIKNNGIQVVICLLKWREFQLLDIMEYPKKVQEAGLVFYHLPIKDRGIPQQRELDTLIPIIVKHLCDGMNILVHCRCGLGRAGTICACCLCHFDYSAKEAIEIVRQQRPGAIQTHKQEQCIINYSGKLEHSK